MKNIWFFIWNFKPNQIPLHHTNKQTENMNTEKIKQLTTTIQSLKSAKFYTVNGWGIVSFKSEIDFTASKNATCFMDGLVSSIDQISLVNELNEVIRPILDKYKMKAEELIKMEVIK